MRQTFSLGKISGIRIGVNWSVLVIVALLAYGLAAGQFPAEVPRHPEVEYIVAGVVTAVAYMGSLLAHELAHSLVARRNGIKVADITLWLLGGVSRLQLPPGGRARDTACAPPARHRTPHRDRSAPNVGSLSARRACVRVFATITDPSGRGTRRVRSPPACPRAYSMSAASITTLVTALNFLLGVPGRRLILSRCGNGREPTSLTVSSGALYRLGEHREASGGCSDIRTYIRSEHGRFPEANQLAGARWSLTADAAVVSLGDETGQHTRTRAVSNGRFSPKPNLRCYPRSFRGRAGLVTDCAGVCF